MSQLNLPERIQAAVDTIQKKTSIRPEIGLIFGSGLSSVGDDVTDAVAIPFGEIPHFHMPSVEGHPGKLVLGKIAGVPVAMLLGRFHFYEDYTMEQVVFPTRVLCKLGIRTLMVTNAAGAVNNRFRPGDVMMITDHLNLMGDNPLRGQSSKALGLRFQDLTEAYHPGTMEILRKSSRELDLPLREGVYAGLMGPCYETPAEIRMLRTLGADAVGMSTVPETIAANHMGVRVAGLSCISNFAAGMTSQKLDHQEVIDTSKIAAKKMRQLIFSAIQQISKQGGAS